MSIYIDYEYRLNAEGNKGSFEEIEHNEGEPDRLLRSLEFEITGFNSSAGEAETVTITGIEVTDHYKDHYLDSAVEIPETIAGAPVTAIAAYASDNTSSDIKISAVTLPKTLKSVGKGAFADMCIMESAEIPASVTEIGEYAFGYTREYDNKSEERYTKIDGFVISCYPGTAGEKYTKDNGFEYKLLTDK